MNQPSLIVTIKVASHYHKIRLIMQDRNIFRYGTTSSATWQPLQLSNSIMFHPVRTSPTYSPSHWQGPSFKNYDTIFYMLQARGVLNLATYRVTICCTVKPTNRKHRLPVIRWIPAIFRIGAPTNGVYNRDTFSAETNNIKSLIVWLFMLTMTPPFFLILSHYNFRLSIKAFIPV